MRDWKSMSKIVVLTDFDPTGSGYKTIAVPLLTRLANMGHEIKVAGLMYRGEENWYPFSVIPCRDLQEGVAIINNLMPLWNPDIILVAMDLPIQKKIFEQVSKFQKKYIAITPLENPPLCMEWAMPLFQMDKVFFISQMGTDAAEKVGLRNVEHLQVGIDLETWHPATLEEKETIRKGLDIPQDAFVVLTVADNQERKNLWAALEAVARLKKEIERPLRYLLVTRVENPYGWRLKDLIHDLDIKKEVVLFERGLPISSLWGLYATADVYLQTSKAEGLGLPVMDAMACGVPVVATDTGALTELLAPDKGHLVPADYVFTDVWGNSLRSMISINETVKGLKCIMETNCAHVDGALEYIRSRTWDIPAKQMDDAIRKMLNE